MCEISLSKYVFKRESMDAWHLWGFSKLYWLYIDCSTSLILKVEFYSHLDGWWRERDQNLVGRVRCEAPPLWISQSFMLEFQERGLEEDWRLGRCQGICLSREAQGVFIDNAVRHGHLGVGLQCIYPSCTILWPFTTMLLEDSTKYLYLMMVRLISSTLAMSKIVTSNGYIWSLRNVWRVLAKINWPAWWYRSCDSPWQRNMENRQRCTCCSWPKYRVSLHSECKLFVECLCRKQFYLLEL